MKPNMLTSEVVKAIYLKYFAYEDRYPPSYILLIKDRTIISWRRIGLSTDYMLKYRDAILPGLIKNWVIYN